MICRSLGSGVESIRCNLLLGGDVAVDAVGSEREPEPKDSGQFARPDCEEGRSLEAEFGLDGVAEVGRDVLPKFSAERGRSPSEASVLPLEGSAVEAVDALKLEDEALTTLSDCTTSGAACLRLSSRSDTLQKA